MVQPVKINVTFKGQPLTKRIYDELPEIHHLYPLPSDFIKDIYAPLLEKAKTENKQFVLTISENKVEVVDLCDKMG